MSRSAFKTLHEVIAAYRELPAMASQDKTETLRDNFAEFVFFEANRHELDALMKAISNAGYVSTTKRPRVAGVSKSGS